MSLFITFEGGEGSGKSYQAGRLYRRLNRLALPVTLVHEPGVTALGKRVSRLLKWAHEVHISPLAELLLFNTARIQLVTEVIRPSLENGEIVICDRYADSTVAYQGYGRGLELSLVRSVNQAGTADLTPDLTILLDLPVTVGLTRKTGRNHDRFEREELDFHHRVRQGYLTLAAEEPERWLVIDAEKSREEIAGIIWAGVSKILHRQKKT